MKELSKEKKEKLIVEWEENGKSRAMFCQEKGIKPTTFCGWVSIFIFCSRDRKLLKILYWDRNGFCMWQKGLESSVIQMD